MRVMRAFTVFATVALVGVACSDNTTAIPAGLKVFTANLNGANERLTPVTTTAKGTAIVTVLGNQLSWKVDITSAIDSITAGHIHHAPIDSAGGVSGSPLGTPVAGARAPAAAASRTASTSGGSSR